MKKPLGIFLLMAVLLTGCYRPGPGAKVWQASSGEASTTAASDSVYVTETPSPTEMVATSKAYATPTPNNPITLPTLRSEVAYYTVQAGDTLAKIAGRYQVSVNQILRENAIANPDIIEVGINLLIPVPYFDLLASPFKIIPDSELVYSPVNADFDVDAFVSSWNGYLASYYQTLDGVVTSGAGVVSRVATEYSVNPRLLLAVLEYQSGWVTESSPASETMVYPMRVYEDYREGLYSQLCWAASFLNEGFYQWAIEAISIWTLTDSTVVEVDPTINAGTAGVLNLMSNLTTAETWGQATSEAGIYQPTCRSLATHSLMLWNRCCPKT